MKTRILELVIRISCSNITPNCADAGKVLHQQGLVLFCWLCSQLILHIIPQEFCICMFFDIGLVGFKA